MVAVGRGHKPPPALALQVVLAHQAADLLGIDDHPSMTELSTNPAIAIGLKLIADRRDIGAIATGFVYLAAILDAWSRRVVGYAISRSIDARVAVAALKAAIRIKTAAEGLHPTTRIVVRNTPPSPTATCWPNMVSSALWADVAIPMTMPRPRAL